ncbi:hypothetical protein [Algirhabdus cladophorae]|uniref:hypothetical protein n=1 Tax=Algirhabdus cladophorae TaxID=3377108 RepID=UPI003B84A0F9
MPVTTDIVQMYRRPRAVVQRLLSMGQREDRALAILMGACLVTFFAQLPRLARQNHIEGGSLERAMTYEFLAWMMLWPLMFYGIAALARLIGKVIGGKGTWFSARITLFWALLAATPMMLLNGLVAGFIGASPALNLVGALWAIAFVTFWIVGWRAAEWPNSSEQVSAK